MSLQLSFVSIQSCAPALRRNTHKIYTAGGVSTARAVQSTYGLCLGCRRNHSGIALVVALVLLLVITLVGLAAVSGTIMQQKMTSNFYDRQIAFQATEGALRQGEIAVQAAVSPAGFRDCSPASGILCLANPFTTVNPSPAITVASVLSTAFDAGKLSAGQPQYVIEYLGKFNVPPPTVTQLSGCSGYASCAQTATANFYRITARSGNPATTSGRASVTLQSIYRD